MKVKYASIILIQLFSLWTLCASEIPKIYIVTEESYPSNYTADDGEIRGFSVEYLEYALQQENVSYDISIYSWNRAYKIASQEDNVLIFPIARTPERESKFHWLHEIMTIKYFIYGLSSRAEEFGQSPDYDQYKIGVIAGGITQKLIEERGFKNIALAKDYTQLNNLINKNRVDFIASSSFGLVVSRYQYPEGYFTPYMKLSDREIKLYYALSGRSSTSVAESLKSFLSKHEEQLVLPN